MAENQQLDHLISTYDAIVHTELNKVADAFIDHYGDDLAERFDTEFLKAIIDICARSNYVADQLKRHPEWIAEWSMATLNQEWSYETLSQQLNDLFGDSEDEAELWRALRVFRNQTMVHLVWRDLLCIASLEETLSEVSNLADVCIQLAYQRLYDIATKRYGTPMSAGDHPVAQELIVLGMGKLGARELNVSSDIDLIFAFPDSGMTDHPDKPIENHQFFTKLGQRLICALDQVTADGFVFRVDMRLRPYGQSGALALNYAAFEDYYQNQGREWERFAMIKARAITGSAEQVERLQKIIHPFVYRRYVDFSSFHALREMKRLIMSEVHRKGGDQNIKLGEGGIREVEFIAQACQLIYGGKDANLQTPALLPVFQELKEQGYLPEEWVGQLLEANAFLRNLEHAIQGFNDKQTQLIPATDDERLRVAWSMQKNDWEAVQQELNQHRQHVSKIFLDFLHDPEEESDQASSGKSAWLHLWQARVGREEWLKHLNDAGFTDAEEVLDKLESLISSRQYGVMSAEAKRRFEQFMPLLLDTVTHYPNPSITFHRVAALVQAVLGRTVYLVLLYENPEALNQLCQLCSESPWVAEHLAKSPVILDELLNVQSLYSPPAKEELQDELRQQLLRIPEDDLEAQMDCLRTFRKSHMLRVAASELGGQLPLMKVSDYLTWLAEALLEQCVNIAWQNMVEKYGLPGGISGDNQQSGFAVIGYGKLGGIELGYSSDLDMVFIYDANDHDATQGDRSINNQLFYTRLGQRVIHILSTQTTQGDLYESDMRLRPSGNSGMLVSSLTAYDKYQHNDAWTWEHQAIVRARFICGDPALGEKFDQVRAKVMTKARDNSELKNEVISMRDKMKLAAIDKYKGEENAKRHIKQGEGGLIDIEFITQFGALSCAVNQPELLEWTDNVRLLETLEKHECFKGVALLPLIDAYRELRAALHRKSLADEAYQVDMSDFAEHRDAVVSAWQAIFS